MKSYNSHVTRQHKFCLPLPGYREICLRRGQPHEVHLTELRDAVNALRARAGLAAATWSPDAAIQQTVTEVKANHILTLRQNLEPALIALGLPHGNYAHPSLAVGSVIYAIDFQELRTQMKAAWSLKINWLVTDQLGTPRMIFDQSGSLANVSRHDYLPFGEELFAV